MATDTKTTVKFDNRVTVRGNAATLLEKKLKAKKKKDRRSTLNNTIAAVLLDYFKIPETE